MFAPIKGAVGDAAGRSSRMYRFAGAKRPIFTAKTAWPPESSRFGKRMDVEDIEPLTLAPRNGRWASLSPGPGHQSDRLGLTRSSQTANKLQKGE